MLTGKKTYVVSALFVIYVVLGELQGQEALRLILEGGEFAALRIGVAGKLGL